MPSYTTWWLRVLMASSALLFPSGTSTLTVTDEALRRIPSPGDDFDIHSGRLLAPILRPRVPGTQGSLDVQRHIVDFFAADLPDWTVVSQNSTSKTPATGDRDVPFVNWIFRRDPPWVTREGDASRLTLVAHFDSLSKPEGFVGAIDSAAPCAMLMHVARSVDAALTTRWKAMQDSGEDGLEDESKGVQIIFLDGEEAFEHWTDTDSIYGARSLAEEWSREANDVSAAYRTPLHSISLFVLLDLLGSPKPTVPSYFLPTHWAYRSMASLEKRMRDLSLLESQPGHVFLPDSDKSASLFGRSGVGDDHVPFMQRGVDILHLIPSPFPYGLWHTMDDDGEHLDLPTCRDWAKIVTAFTVEWFELGEYMPATGKMARAAPDVSHSSTESSSSRRTEL
ncbi:Peptidase family M28 [Geosmithia morbida]|uniref:Peptide hydrolase n=1 Tax=Geosmithia morbida TaxID=1094350 RepID=A0A9P4YXI6_9HYPO|nr:Peptidase family M28 [Geosmithia morbida]KAF4124913.1 Peptidase family M28 [Geosmithia morbida]